MSDVFISYSRHNIQFAEKLFNALKERNISAWVDWQDIPRSAGWWDEIKRGIDNASTFLFLMSNASVSSPVCTLELAHAIENGKRILPVILEPPNFDMALEKLGALQPDDVLTTIIAGRDISQLSRHNHGVIGHINWIFFGKNPQGDELTFEQSLLELLTTIKTDLEHNRRHARFLILAREWETNARDDDFLLMGDELILAEKWLSESNSRKKEPTPTPLHIEYIRMSRTAEDMRNRRLQNIRRASVIASMIAVVAMFIGAVGIIIANQAQGIANQAQRDAQEANNQVATATAVIATSVAVQNLAQAERDEARTRGQILSTFANAILRSQDNPQGMIAQLSALIEQYPNEAMAYHVRGLAYYQINDYDQALINYDRAVELDATLNDVFSNRGNVYFTLGDYAKALDNYTQAIALSPMDALAYNNRGNAYVLLDERDNALADYNRAIELDPMYALAYSNRGNFYRAIGELDLALSDFNNAIQYDPQLTIAYYNRGNTYYDFGEYDKARADYDRAIQLDPQYAAAYTNRGLAYRQLGNTQQSIADYNRAIQLDPQNSDAYVNRGYTYYNLRDYARAIVDYTSALAINPQDTDVYYNRGLAYALSDQIRLALADFDQIIALGNDNGYLGRGLTHYINADYEAALADWSFYENATGEFPDTFESFRTDALSKVGDG
ncbi:MAG: tetratricopeptide repeat protein [bacterium]|nr:tetratricopeptide repeat protein [bacterium]